MPKLNSTTRILRYHGASLRASDRGILESATAWFNDRVLAFGLEAIAHASPIAPYAESIAFLEPSASFMFSFLDCESVKLQISPLNLGDMSFVIVPVNDNEDLELANGGSHWSLLALNCKTHTFSYFDSGYGTTNERIARSLARVLHTILFQNDAGPSVQFVVCDDCAKQENSFDCGLHLINNALAYLANECSLAAIAPSARFTRKSLLQILDDQAELVLLEE
ncbi:mitochondrial Ulp1 protease family protein (possible sentrin-specific protease) [Andalucia godoyi]|uniref:Mitochondrial Ulp1 protease family protein (Possible sentrin-specific protease) n=1 Tax=Andalucia godoyi TaxID=505711 RepID=A0A8K0AI59_ANDGO|nr:mitochondrial Ulp1 protease family protein (possible sentrin-specific protease) [Andalucia godoyi]|eukprot:ANDGO_02119.mRNA.1 mitochondrial Ulp1 protease family protein (possible sentrin-specific protease)